MPLKISIPQSPEQREKKERQERITQRKLSKKTTFTNAEVIESINDLHAEMEEIKKLLIKR